MNSKIKYGAQLPTFSITETGKILPNGTVVYQ